MTTKNNKEIQALWVNILALRGLIENVRNKPASIKAHSSIIASKLRLIVKIPSIHSLHSVADVTSIYATLNTISQFVASANNKAGWGIIDDCSLFAINLVALFNQLLDGIVARKTYYTIHLNIEFIRFIAHFPKYYPSHISSTHKIAIRIIIGDLLLSLGLSEEDENSSVKSKLFYSCLVLFKLYPEITTTIALELLSHNRRYKFDPIDKSKFSSNILKLIVEYLIGNDKLDAHALVKYMAVNHRIDLFERAIFEKILLRSFVSGKQFNSSLLMSIYKYKLAFVQLSHLKQQLEKFANQYLCGYIPTQFADSEKVLALLSSSQIKCLALMRLHHGAQPIAPELVKNITYALQALLLEPIRTPVREDLVARRLQQLILSAICAEKSQVDMRVMSLCHLPNTSGVSICSDFVLSIQTDKRGACFLIDNSMDSRNLYNPISFNEAANYIISRSHKTRSKAIRDLGFEVTELFIVPELSKQDFTHTVLRRSITPVYLEGTKNKPSPASPYKRAYSYPQDGVSLDQITTDVPYLRLI